MANVIEWDTRIATGRDNRTLLRVPLHLGGAGKRETTWKWQDNCLEENVTALQAGP